MSVKIEKSDHNLKNVEKSPKHILNNNLFEILMHTLNHASKFGMLMWQFLGVPLGGHNVITEHNLKNILKYNKNNLKNYFLKNSNKYFEQKK